MLASGIIPSPNMGRFSHFFTHREMVLFGVVRESGVLGYGVFNAVCIL